MCAGAGAGRPADPRRRPVRRDAVRGSWMAKVVYFDCPSGASGDMMLGALVDAGVGIEALRAELRSSRCRAGRSTAREVRRGAFRATKVDVEVDRGRRITATVISVTSSTILQRQHARADRRSEQAHADLHAAGRGRGARARRRPRVRSTSTRWARSTRSSTSRAPWSRCTLLGADGVSRLGAAASAAASWTGRTAGSRSRRRAPSSCCAASRSSTPASRAELVTPTGAAILTTLADGAGPHAGHDRRARRLRRRHARSARHRQRAALFRRRADGAAATAVETIAQVETTIDDMSPQLYEPLMERLLEAGAARRLPRPRHHEAQPARNRAHRAVSARSASTRCRGCSSRSRRTIGVRWTEMSRAPPAARDGDARRPRTARCRSRSRGWRAAW